jgi:hypothetical protein
LFCGRGFPWIFLKPTFHPFAYASLICFLLLIPELFEMEDKTEAIAMLSFFRFNVSKVCVGCMLKKIYSCQTNTQLSTHQVKTKWLWLQQNKDEKSSHYHTAELREKAIWQRSLFLLSLWFSTAMIYCSSKL